MTKVAFDVDRMDAAAAALKRLGAPVGPPPDPPNMPNPHAGRCARASSASASAIKGVPDLLVAMGKTVGHRAQYARDGRVWTSTAPTAAIARARIKQGKKLAESLKGRGVSPEEVDAILWKAGDDPDVAAGFAKTIGHDVLLQMAQISPFATGRLVGAAASPNGDTGRGAFTQKQLDKLFADLQKKYVVPDREGPIVQQQSTSRAYDLESFFGGLSQGAGLVGPQPVEIGKEPSALTRALINLAATTYYAAKPSKIPRNFLKALSAASARSADDIHKALSSDANDPLTRFEATSLQAIALLLGTTKAKIPDLRFTEAMGRYQQGQLVSATNPADYRRVLGEIRTLEAAIGRALTDRSAALAQAGADAKDSHNEAVKLAAGIFAAAVVTIATAGAALPIEVAAGAGAILLGTGIASLGTKGLTPAQVSHLQGLVDANAKQADVAAVATALAYLTACQNNGWKIPAIAKQSFMRDAKGTWVPRPTSSAGNTIPFSTLARDAKLIVPEASAN